MHRYKWLSGMRSEKEGWSAKGKIEGIWGANGTSYVLIVIVVHNYMYISKVVEPGTLLVVQWLRIHLPM